MSFLYPIFIYLMLPLLAVLFFFIFTGSKENFKMFDKEVLDKLRLESKALSKNARYALFFTAFILMVFALAQPVIKEGEIKVEAKSADILIGIDISDSMKAEDRYPNRLVFSKQKAMELIKSAPHNRIGVLAFAKHDYIVSPLSFDHSSVAFLLSKVNTTNITEKGTHLDSMLNSAIAMLEHAKEKNILLFTDGGDVDDFSKEIALAKESGLRIFIIGVGSEQGSPVRANEGGFIKQDGKILISKLNPKLKSLALETGGVYIESVLGEDDIKTMMNEIEKMAKKSTLKEETIPQYTQLFYYPLALAALFLLLAFSSFPKRMAKSLALVPLLFIFVQDGRAGMLDFQKLKEAKEAYAKQEYKTSSKIYEDFAVESPEAVYNLGNSLYKEGEFERALKVYSSLNAEGDLQAKTLANKGNTQVKLKKYEEALKAYENSLALKEDKQTRENYEAVKKFLEEQKKKEQNKKDKNKDKDKDKKDDKKNQDKKSDKNKDNKNNKDNKDKKESKESKDKQKSENKEKNDKDKKKSKNKEQKDEKKKSDAQKNKEQKDKDKQAQKEKEKQKKQEQKEKTKKEKEKEEQKSQGEMKKVPVSQQKMSDLEAKKWLKMIKKSQKGHLYKMNQVEHKEDENEKPW